MQPIARNNSVFIPVLLLTSMWYNMNGALPCWSCSSRKEYKKKKAPNTLRSWSFWHPWPTVLSSRRSSLFWGSLEYNFWPYSESSSVLWSELLLLWRGRELPSRSHLQQLMWFWPILWKGSMRTNMAVLMLHDCWWSPFIAFSCALAAILDWP